MGCSWHFYNYRSAVINPTDYKITTKLSSSTLKNMLTAVWDSITFRKMAQMVRFGDEE